MDDEGRTFFVRRRPDHDKLVLEIGGECDAATVDELDGALLAAVAESPAELVVDLEEATFVDSMTLAALTAAAQRLRTIGGLFRVIGADAPHVRRAFELTGLDRYLLHAAG